MPQTQTEPQSPVEKPAIKKEKVPVDILMIKHLLSYELDEFRVELPWPLKDYKDDEMQDISVRFAIPTSPDKKHFVARTFNGQCYRIEHEGQGAHKYSVHVFRKANDDEHAVKLLEKHEATKRVSPNNTFAFA